jgi:hypothetical protein
MSDDGGDFGGGDETYGSSTETEYESGVSRLGNSFIGALSGVFLFFAAFGVLGWNEGRSVKTYRAIKEGASKVEDVTCIPDAMDNGALVHITCDLDNLPKLSDEYWGGPGNLTGVFIQRNIQTYAWKETKKTTSRKSTSGGGGKTKITTYTCTTEWISGTPESETFKCKVDGTIPRNPTNFPPWAQYDRTPAATAREQIKAGDWILPEELVSKITTTMPLDATDFSNCEPNSTDSTDPTWTQMLAGAKPKCNQDGYSGPGKLTTSSTEIAVVGPQDRTSYQNVQIGDMRLSWTASSATEVSVIAEQKDGSFVPYKADSGVDIFYLEETAMTAAEMFAKAKEENRVLTILLRIIGFLIMWVGLYLMLAPLAVMGDCIPCIGPAIGDLIEAGACCITCPIALFFSLITIALAWLFYRPMIAVPLLVVACGCAYAVYHFRKQGAEKKAAKAGMNSNGVPLETIGVQNPADVPPMAPQSQQMNQAMPVAHHRVSAPASFAHSALTLESCLRPSCPAAP